MTGLLPVRASFERACGIDEDVGGVLRVAQRDPRHSVELLVKPPQIDFDPKRLFLLGPDLAAFPAIGVTEEEIGGSMSARLRFIAALRAGLDKVGVSVPIHVFDGLDPS